MRDKVGQEIGVGARVAFCGPFGAEILIGRVTRVAPATGKEIERHEHYRDWYIRKINEYEALQERNNWQEQSLARTRVKLQEVQEKIAHGLFRVTVECEENSVVNNKTRRIVRDGMKLIIIPELLDN